MPSRRNLLKAGRIERIGSSMNLLPTVRAPSCRDFISDMVCVRVQALAEVAYVIFSLYTKQQ